MLNKLKGFVQNILTLGLSKKIHYLKQEVLKQQDTLNDIHHKNHSLSLQLVENLHASELMKRFEYNKSVDKNKPSMLILARVVKNGGVEERIYKMIQELKKEYNIFFLTAMDRDDFHKIHQDKDIFVYSTFRFTGYEEYLTQYVRKIICFHNISVVEVNFSGIIKLYYLFLRTLPNLKLVAVFHGGFPSILGVNKDYYQDIIPNFHHIVLVGNERGKQKLNHSSVTIIRNGAGYLSNIYQYRGSNGILLVSRLDMDKLDSIIPILDFARKHNLDIDIAGVNVVTNTAVVREYIQTNYSDLNIHFLGYVDTQQHLIDHNGKYLFIAGVGQVILEAIALGYPALCSDYRENQNLAFVTKSNWEDLFYHNFATIPQLEENLDRDFIDLKNNICSHFDIFNLIKNKISIEQITKEYIALLKS